MTRPAWPGPQEAPSPQRGPQHEDPSWGAGRRRGAGLHLAQPREKGLGRLGGAQAEPPRTHPLEG